MNAPLPRLWGFAQPVSYGGKRIPQGAIAWGPPDVQARVGAKVTCDLTPSPICGILGLGLNPGYVHSRVFYRLCSECQGQRSGLLTSCVECGGSGKVPE